MGGGRKIGVTFVGNLVMNYVMIDNILTYLPARHAAEHPEHPALAG